MPDTAVYAASQARTNMAKVIVTFRIMPESPEVDLNILEKKANELISKTGTVMESKKEPIGFGLVALIVKFNMDESKGSTDELENEIKKINGVESVEVIAVSRAFG